MVTFTAVSAKEPRYNHENRCKIAINEKTDYQVLGIYGSPIESEWHPSAVYVLLRKMYKFEVLLREFKQKSPPWRFEFVEMSSRKTMAFVYNLEDRSDYCSGPNAFYVIKK